MLPPLPESWRPRLAEETAQPYYRQLDAFLDTEVAAGHVILPGVADIFHALAATPYDRVRVVVLGQDPYPTPGHAHGLCFSVRPDVRPLPRSLRNVFRELQEDLGCPAPDHGCLEHWAEQGVLLLNTVLTVRAGAANSHQGRGWERFTDRVIEAVDARATRVVFVFWGASARTKRTLVRGRHHAVIEAAHPSPLSARKFFGCRCFSQVNRLLEDSGQAPIEWEIPEALNAPGRSS